MRDLGTLGGWGSEAVAINDRGQVVGSSDTKRKTSWGESIKHAFLWQNGKITDLAVLRARDRFSEALDINAQGQIVGESALCDFRSVDLSSECDSRAVLWTLKR